MTQDEDRSDDHDTQSDHGRDWQETTDRDCRDDPEIDTASQTDTYGPSEANARSGEVETNTRDGEAETDTAGDGEETQTNNERAETLQRRAVAAERAIARLEELVQQERAKREAIEAELKKKRARIDDYIEAQRERMDDEKRRATASLVDDLLERVWEPLGRGIDADSEAELREGFELIRKEFRSVLSEANVEVFEPEPGAEVDHDRHEVLRTVERPGLPSGQILAVESPGFRMDGEIERRAEVFVVD